MQARWPVADEAFGLDPSGAIDEMAQHAREISRAHQQLLDGICHRGCQPDEVHQLYKLVAVEHIEWLFRATRAESPDEILFSLTYARFWRAALGHMGQARRWAIGQGRDPGGAVVHALEGVLANTHWIPGFLATHLSSEDGRGAAMIAFAGLVRSGIRVPSGAMVASQTGRALSVEGAAPDEMRRTLSNLLLGACYEAWCELVEEGPDFPSLREVRARAMTIISRSAQPWKKVHQGNGEYRSEPFVRLSDLPGETPSPSDFVDALVTRDEIDTAIRRAKLTDWQMEIFLLHYDGAGLTSEAIGEMLGVAASTVRVTYREAHEKIRRTFETPYESRVRKVNIRPRLGTYE
jgi:DNA-directed RNA polymerase specialized sigma24 family protein